MAFQRAGHGGDYGIGQFRVHAVAGELVTGLLRGQVGDAQWPGKDITQDLDLLARGEGLGSRHGMGGARGFGAGQQW